jgi:hypothetical protein
MGIQRLHRSLALILQAFSLATASYAMTMPHYDVNSLVYMSTDIVIAKISEDSQHNFSATVIQSLYGSLRPNDRVDRLSPFLTFFRPMEDGMRVVLFLDRRPRQYDFLHSDAAKSPFAVPPSGVYLIDEYEHVHEYFQPNSPGPYVAQGYSFFFEKRVPTKEQDLALPNLDAVKNRIAVAIKSVEPVRHLLEKVAARSDAAALMRLVDLSSKSEKDCDLRTADGIREVALHQIRSLNDPELLLQAYSSARVSAAYAVPFITPITMTSGDKEFTAARVKYLLYSLSNRKKDSRARAAALEILLQVAKSHSGPQSGPSKPLPIDNYWLSNFGTEIQATSKAIFDRRSENAHLRAHCVQFLSLDDPAVLSDVKQVYQQTSSPELRFAIEKAFLDVSDVLYQSLKPRGGPVASRISPAEECGCARLTHKSIAFAAEYRESQQFHQQNQFTIIPHPAITELHTGRRIVFKDIHNLGGWSSVLDGQFQFEFRTLSHVPAGNYLLSLEYADGNKIVSTGYGPKLSIRETHQGKVLSIKESANR